MRTLFASVLIIGLIGCASTTPSVQPTPSAPPAESVRTPVRPETRDGAPLAYLSQLPPLIDREALFDDPEITGGQLSPNGKWISFRKPYQGVMNVWVKVFDQPFSAGKPLTADTKRPIVGYFWSQDSKYVLYVQDKGGDENYRVYAVDPAAKVEEDTGVPLARDLTPFEKVRAQIYAVPKRDPRHILVGLNDRDPALHDVYRIDLQTGKRELLFRNDQNVASWVFDLNGKLRMALRQTSDGGTELLRVDGNNLKEIYSCTFEENCFPDRFHKDGKRVYIQTNKGDRDLTSLVLLDLQSGKEQLVDKDPQGEVDFGGAVYSRASDDLLATYYVGDRLRIYPKNPQFEQDYRLLKQKLPDGDLQFTSASRDERRRLVSVTSDVDPGAVYLFDHTTKKVELLYRPRPKLPLESLANMKPVRYPARDGVSVPAYLTLPKNVEPKGLPVILYVHGGPWARDTWGYDSFAQFLANRGYAVLQPNFRASTGYGKRFLNLGNNQWGTGTMQHDLSDGVKWLVSQGIADPKRVAIFGGSYGGYATLAGLAFTPELYAAGVDIVGPSNIVTLLNSIPPYWAPIKKIFSKRVGDLDVPADVERMKSQSPLFSAKQIRAPLLVIQGKNDPRVKQAESDQIVVALRELRLPVAYLVAPDEGHGYAGRENRLAMIVEIERFLSKHLGGRSQEGMADDVRQRLAAITVDVKTVTASAAPAAPATATSATSAPAAAGAMPAFSGEALAPIAVTYSQQIEIGGRKLASTVTRTISADQLEGRKVWKVIDSAQSQMGAAEDTLWLDAKTLLPLKRSLRQGPATADLTIVDGQVKGELRAGPSPVPISAKLEGPTLLDGAAVELAIGTLPLAPGYRATLRSFNALASKTQSWTAEVAGREKLDVQGKPVDVHRVNLSSEDGSTAVMWIEASAPHRLIKSEASLQTQMGPGKFTKAIQGLTVSERGAIWPEPLRGWEGLGGSYPAAAPEPLPPPRRSPESATS